MNKSDLQQLLELEKLNNNIAEQQELLFNEEYFALLQEFSDLNNFVGTNKLNDKIYSKSKSARLSRNKERRQKDKTNYNVL